MILFAQKKRYEDIVDDLQPLIEEKTKPFAVWLDDLIRQGGNCLWLILYYHLMKKTFLVIFPQQLSNYFTQLDCCCHSLSL